MDVKQQIEQIEVSLEEVKKIADLGDRAYKLANNRDFKAVVIEGYFKDEAVRLTGLLGDPNTEQHEIYSALHSIAAFRRYLSKLVLLGNVANKEILDHTNTLDELRQYE